MGPLDLEALGPWDLWTACVVRSLLDNCIVTTESNIDNIESSMGKIVFDFFLFHPDNSGHELALVDLVIATGSDANFNSMIRI